MNYLGIEYSIKNVPVLDDKFIPFGVWMREYLKGPFHVPRALSMTERVLTEIIGD